MKFGRRGFIKAGIGAALFIPAARLDFGVPKLIVPEAADILLPPGLRFVAVNGSDDADGLTPATAWRTVNKAITAPHGSTVQIAPGQYEAPTKREWRLGEIRSNGHGLTLRAQYPAMLHPDDPGLHAVFDGMPLEPAGGGLIAHNRIRTVPVRQDNLKDAWNNIYKVDPPPWITRITDG